MDSLVGRCMQIDRRHNQSILFFSILRVYVNWVLNKPQDKVIKDFYKNIYRLSTKILYLK